ncbi:MAG: sulfotransferase [Pseudomonadota bacterium]
MTKSARDLYEEGKLLERKGDLDGALNAYRLSLRLNSKIASPWIGLANVLDKNQQPRDALECLKRGAAVEPHNTVVVTKLARSFQGLGQVEDAERSYLRALSIDAEFHPALLGFGQLMEDVGEADKAAHAYRKILLSDKAHAEAFGYLLGLGRHVDVSVEINQAKRFIEDADNRSKALIGYGLGKGLDQLGRYDEAFATFEIANTARREMTGPFDREAFDRRVNRMIELFSKAFFEKRDGWGHPSDTPVFIVGLPRSGTTLTEQILGSHPACFGAGELAILTDLATGTPDRLGRRDRHWPECAPDLSSDQTKALGGDYLNQLRALAKVPVSRISDKQPLNFWHLGLIAIALPNAKIIHCHRDIRDVGLSIFMQNFNLSQLWSTDLTDICHYWQGYRRLMAHWNDVASLNVSNFAYEDTVADLESQARHLLSFLGLHWDNRVMAFHENDRAVQTPSRWQVRQPIYKSSRAKWQNYKQYLAPLIEAFEAEQG